MKTVLGLLFFILGFFCISVLIFKETDRKTMWKIVISGVCGLLVMGGLIILLV